MPAILAQEGGNEVRELVLFDCSRAVAVGGAGGRAGAGVGVRRRGDRI